MSPGKQKALAALLTSPTKKAAAEKAGINERTLRDYFKDREFLEEYNRAFAGVVQDAARAAQQTLQPALSTLREIVESEDENAQARIAASKIVLEYSLKLTEQVDVLTRLDELEGQIGGSNGNH